MITNSNVPDLKVDSVMKRYLYRDIFCEEYKAGSKFFSKKQSTRIKYGEKMFYTDLYNKMSQLLKDCIISYC